MLGSGCPAGRAASEWSRTISAFHTDVATKSAVCAHLQPRRMPAGGPHKKNCGVVRSDTGLVGLLDATMHCEFGLPDSCDVVAQLAYPQTSPSTLDVESSTNGEQAKLLAA